MNATRTGARAALVACGALFLVQGGAKALDPVGYMAALDAFHVLAPVALRPLSLGALGLVWTVLELCAAVAMLHGGLARAPSAKLPLAGVAVALGLSVTHLALAAGALVRHLPIPNETRFGGYFADVLSTRSVVVDVAVIGVLVWLFVRVASWWQPRYLRTTTTSFPVLGR